MEAELIKRHDDAEAVSSTSKRYPAPTCEPKKIPAKEYD